MGRGTEHKRRLPTTLDGSAEISDSWIVSIALLRKWRTHVRSNGSAFLPHLDIPECSNVQRNSIRDQDILRV